MEILNCSPISKNLFSNSSNMLDCSNADLLKCGSCCSEFLLSDICMFIQHKNKPCCMELNDHHYQQQNTAHPLRCTSCAQTFRSAYNLLEHAQYFHKINLFTNNQKRLDEPMVTPKKEIFIDVSPPSEESTNYPPTQKNRSASLSLSSTSPATSSTSSLSSNFLSQGSFKEPTGKRSHQTQKQRCNSISFDFRDSGSKNESLKSNFFGNNSQSMIDQNENTSSSIDSNPLNKYESFQNNKDSFFSIQNTSSPKQSQNTTDGSFDENVKKLTRLNVTTGDEKKKKSKQQASFYCDICHAAFNQKIHLTKHSAKHTGIKPFKCSECNYSTVERSHLKVHVRVHTGEKPFKCSFCEYATAQSSTLKIHKKRHHDKLDEPVQEKFREAPIQNEDSLSQPCLEIDTDNIKTESIEQTKESIGKNNFNSSHFYSQNFNNNTNKIGDYTSSENNNNFPIKRTKNFSPDKTKRLTNYFDISQRLSNKNSLNQLYNNSNQFFNKNDFMLQANREAATTDGQGIVCNINSSSTVASLGLKFKTSVSSQAHSFTLNDQLTEAENKLLGLANIALEREIN